MARWVEDVALLLADVKSKDRLLAAARLLKVADGSLNRVRDPYAGCLYLAHHLLAGGHGLSLYQAMAEIAGAIKPRDSLRQLIGKVAPTWVNWDAARILLELVAGQPRVALVNTVRQRTGEDYVNRATYCADRGFEYRTVTATATEAFLREFEEECAKEVASMLGVDEPDEIDQVLAWISEADREVLFLLVHPGTTAPGLVAEGGARRARRHDLYLAPNTDQGFLRAIAAAVYIDPPPTVLCIGWGESEDSWTAQARAAIGEVLADAAALGVTVCVAAGDGGSASSSQDRQSRVFFPASSPYALACGGTTLQADQQSGRVHSEVVWPDTGGGISDVFPVPPWQAVALGGGSLHAEGRGTGRGVPDVAANADPMTGYRIPFVKLPARAFGGTALSAALWAALACCLAQASGRRLGLLQPSLYAGATPGEVPPGFTSITEGNNGAYRAGPGWDPCTGLGTPRGTDLLRRLSGGS
jgi:hypothetical protein